MGRPTKWSQDREDDLLLALCRTGAPLTRAAAMVGVAGSTVKGWRKARPEFAARLEVARSADPEAREELAKRIKRSRAARRNWAPIKAEQDAILAGLQGNRRKGKPGRPTRQSSRKVSAMLDLLRAGWSVTAAADAIQIGRSTWQGWIARDEKLAKREAEARREAPKECPPGLLIGGRKLRGDIGRQKPRVRLLDRPGGDRLVAAAR